MKVVAALVLAALVISCSSILGTPAAAASSYCNEKCGVRCAKAGAKERCLKYCGICCADCKCVPSGTFGNKHECPCYRDKTNSKGKSKCP